MFYEFVVGEETYELVLTTKSVIQLEKRIGCNPLLIFGDGETIPTVDIMIEVLLASFQKFNHGIGKDEVCDIFDAWLREGHTMPEFIPIIVEIYKKSGLIKNEERKN